VVTESELLAAVETASAITGAEMAPWPDPHPDRSPADDEYSRLTNAAKWRLLGARADAWITATTDLGLARLERNVAVQWATKPASSVSFTDCLVPRRADALVLVVARSVLGEIDDAGVTLGVSDPAICTGLFPDCGCDACDSGFQDEIDHLDAHILGVVSGAFRHLSKRDRTITVIGGDGWGSSGLKRRDNVEAILADPVGWDEVSGPSWLSR